MELYANGMGLQEVVNHMRYGNGSNISLSDQESAVGRNRNTVEDDAVVNGSGQWYRGHAY